MTAPNIVAKWAGWAPQLRSALRIVAAFMFILAGTVKLFAFPIGMPPNGSTAPLLSEFWFAGVLETFGGALLLLGLFQFAFPVSFWPVVNNGIPLALYCFVWLYFSAAGAGPWSLDARREKRYHPPTP